MNIENYIKPEIDFIEFSNEDVIVTSIPCPCFNTGTTYGSDICPGLDF